jgi:NDP-sugar pyrophosphorylase family protein
VIAFREKPTQELDVSMGVYVFSRRLLQHVPANRPFGFDDLVLTLLRHQCPVHVYPFAGYWLDIGRPADYDKAIQDLGLAFTAPQETRGRPGSLWRERI